MKTDSNPAQKEKTLPYNPSAREYNNCGPLFFDLQVDGEEIINCRLVSGGGHRGLEKTLETHRYNRLHPWLEKINSAGGEINNLGYCLAVENLLGLEIPPRVKWIRTIISEIYRVSSHLNWLAELLRHLEDLTTAERIGKLTIYTEKIISSLEQNRAVSGFIRVGGLREDIPPSFHDDCQRFMSALENKLPRLKEIIFENPLFGRRTKTRGALGIEAALDFGVTGPDLRATGAEIDVRTSQPYGMYDELDFMIPVGENGDAYDRCLVRVEEIFQSLKIIEQAVEQVAPAGIFCEESGKFNIPTNNNPSTETLIHHHILCREGFEVPGGETYRKIESPRGEMGFFIVADGTNTPYRCHISPPSPAKCQVLVDMLPGCSLDEAEIIIESFDLSLPEVNR